MNDSERYVANVAELTLAGFQENRCTVPFYDDLLSRICADIPPLFSTREYLREYQSRSSKPDWFLGSLASNAVKEGEGSARLLDMVQRVADPNVATQIWSHAKDEARHAKYYVAMASLAFPRASTIEVQVAVDPFIPDTSLCPGQGTIQSVEDTLDELIQMNIGEIRTRYHQLMLSPVLRAYCRSDPDRPRRIIDSIISDETSHVYYTAHILEQYADHGYRELIREVMAYRWREFDLITAGELEGRRPDSFVT